MITLYSTSRHQLCIINKCRNRSEHIFENSGRNLLMSKFVITFINYNKLLKDCIARNLQQSTVNKRSSK